MQQRALTRKSPSPLTYRAICQHVRSLHGGIFSKPALCVTLLFVIPILRILIADLAEPLNDADGLILYALPASEEEVTKLVEKVNDRDTANREEVLIAIPRTIGFLRDAVTQLAYLHWIAENTPELEGDAVARRELSIRMIEAERGVTDRLVEIFGANSEGACTWYHKGQPADIKSPKAKKHIPVRNL